MASATTGVQGNAAETKPNASHGLTLRIRNGNEVYEVLRPFFNGGYWGQANAKGMDALEALWDHLPGAVGNVNAISVVDTSGSMYWAEKLKPALISQAMGLYCAERCEGVFHNHLITFESTPHLMEIHGATLRDKLKYIGSLPVGGSTNLEAVFDLIVDTAVKSRAKQAEMPQVLYICLLPVGYASEDSVPYAPWHDVYRNISEFAEVL